MKTLIAIPARYDSTRFPGKPLAPIAGASMLHRVIAVARAAADAVGGEVIVATDDDRIRDHADLVGAKTVMTPAACRSGTDRVHAALMAMGAKVDFAVNLQGDAPFTSPSHIVDMVRAAESHDADCFTTVVPMTWDELDALRRQKQDQPFSGTTCARRADGSAYWFSKTIIPAIRKEAALRAASAVSPVLRHIGLYGYRADALAAFVAAPESPYEALEGLEQLRFLENGMRIHAIDVVASEISMTGIDTPDDVAIAEELIRRHGDPHRAA